MRGFLIALLLLLLAGPAWAQGSAELRGRVVDAETGQPVPNAQVGVAGNRLGTSTNVDGIFTLNIPPAYQHEPLEVALLGYRKYTQALPPLPGPGLLIRLQISPAALGEVTVTSSVMGIIRAAVARIPRNYPMRPARLTGFYREAENVLGDSSQYQYFAEGLLTVYQAGYQHPGDDGAVEIRESRKVELRAPGTADHNWYGGPFVPHQLDFVHRRAAFINPAHFRDYDYRLLPQTTFRGRPVYVIAFAPKPGRAARANFAGRLFIEENSYAFLRAEWHRTPAGLRHESQVAVAIEERASRADYQPYAGRWYLKSAWHRTQGRPRLGNKAPISVLVEYLTTGIDTAQGLRPGYAARAQYRDVYLENPVPYDSTFWQRQTTLVPPAAVQQALRRAAAPVPAAAGAPGPVAGAPAAPAAPVRRPSRLRYGYLVGGWPVAVAGGAVQAGFAPAGSGFQALGSAELRAQSTTYWYGFSYEYNAVGGWWLRLGSRSGFEPLGGSGWEGGLAYERNLNPRRRPIFARSGLTYFRQSVGRDLGPYHNPDAGLRVAGTAFKADEIGLTLQTTTGALQPKLGLGVELSHHLELVADAGYLLFPRTRTQLALDERSGFWLSRSAATLDLPAADATLRVNGQPATGAPWQPGRLTFGFGLLYRPR
ncbi:carboxypeptidase-like regulatory domain-containing protein [Hymenobacter sp. PAMC 26628]|uniref:carboxypeptidase-like regulatory domain-containing protein n=1 Tax=Hymenobacter sp. PAMC 26628 TaxID=1484118 RepID=UPI00077013E4|nr:carboxypeptidase-like regulatory domain-containing protein [Hymenobacter sp. PAMC 26628]AMJ67219.1 hypothetical protein AXW84_18610 [Hymenobacter sp. PAMC 26628]